MAKDRFYSPLKIGLIIVAFAYFIFTFHAMFTLSWIGEWESMSRSLGFVIFVEDISGSIGLVFRFVSSLTALIFAVLFIVKKDLQSQTKRKILRTMIVGEAIYWLGLLPSGILPLIYWRGPEAAYSPISALISILSLDIPCLVESTFIPIALFILAFKLSPSKPAKGAIKWGLITGTIYIFVFWLVNTGIWILAIKQKGIEYITSYPEILLSFALTVLGLLALTVFTAMYSKKSIGTDTLRDLNLKTAGATITLLGLYFLWTYLTWIFFGRPELWSAWYQWLLGHNLDLWLLSIPMVGLPLLFEQKASPLHISQKEGAKTEVQTDPKK